MPPQRLSDASMSSRRSSGRPSTTGKSNKSKSRASGSLTQSRRPGKVASPDPEDEDEVPDNDDEEADASFAGDDNTTNGNKKGLAKEDLDRLVKNFVRYALACEFTRTPIRRDEISKKVLESKYTRSFNQVFAQTQARLQSVFRMILIELPAKEKHQTIQQQRRNAQNKLGAAMKSWILMTTLPDEIRALPNLLEGDDERDSTYQGFVTMIISLIYLNGGVLQEESLNRYLRYLSIEETTPLMPTEKLLSTMAKQGYIDKVKDMVTGEPRFDYHLGPRGKIEVGKKGTLEFISRVYGDEMNNDLEKRIRRSMADLDSATVGGEDEGPPRKRVRQEGDEGTPPARSQRRQDMEEAPRAESSRSRRSRPEPEEEQEDGDEEENEEEEEQEEEAPPSRRNGKAPARDGGRGRGRGRGRGSVRGRSRS